MTSIDFNGTDITLGATVVYPTRRKSDMHLSQGVVLDILHGDYENTGKVKVEVRTDKGERRVVYVPVSRVLVQNTSEVRNALRVFKIAADKLLSRIEFTNGTIAEACVQSLRDASAETQRLGLF